MVNPWMWVGALLVVIGAYFYGHSEGADSTLAKWNAEKAELNAQALSDLQVAHARVKEVEKEMDGRLQVANNKYLKVIKEKKNAEAAAIDRAGSGGLFINAKCEGGADPLSGATGLTVGSHGTKRVELPRADGEFLIRLAAEADRVAEQLSACQAVLKEERK